MLNLLKRNGIADLTRAQVQILPLYSTYCRSPSFVPFHDVFAPTLEICHVIYAHAQTLSLSDSLTVYRDALKGGLQVV